jgi:LmbE family N-acetylglucosaminyl deacetylase
VLAVFAHPDDEVLCGAGTLAMCAARGARVTLVSATRGELGPIASPELATRETLPQVRERELKASCAKLGITDVRFLGLPDAGVNWAAEDAGTVSNLVVLIRELEPKVVITFGPDGLYGHFDHEAIGELTTKACDRGADDEGVRDCGGVQAEVVLPGDHVEDGCRLARGCEASGSAGLVVEVEA